MDGAISDNRMLRRGDGGGFCLSADGLPACGIIFVMRVSVKKCVVMKKMKKKHKFYLTV